MDSSGKDEHRPILLDGNEMKSMPGASPFGPTDGQVHQGKAGLDEDIDQEEEQPASDLSIVGGMLYILGATAGSGMIAAPKATVGAGLIGLISLPLIVLIAIFTAIALARCWLITTKVNAAYQGEVRYPLAAIAFMAFGHPGKVFTSAMMGVALFCYSVVNLLAASSTFEAMTKDWLPMPLCGWLIIVAAVVCPITWFRTPRESLPVAVTAFLVSLTAASIMFIVILTDTSTPLHVEYPKVTFVSLCNAWSTYAYTVAGHPYFTTIQNAMKRQSAFKVSVALALLGSLSLYEMTILPSFFIYGGAIYGTADNLLYYLPYNAGQVIAGLLLAIHFGTVMVIMNTPINLYIEERMNLPKETTWQMCLIRSLVMVTELLVALLIPHYGEFLTLVGAFLALPIVFILPSLFYLRLRNMDDTVPNGIIGMLLNSTAVHLGILAIGIVLCLGSVYSSFQTLVLEGAHLAIPCFVNFTAL